MPTALRRSIFRLLLVVCLCSLVHARQPTPAPAHEVALNRLVRPAGSIFAGTVLAVAPVMAERTNGLAAMEITFRVDVAVRGVRVGQVLKVREWAGLWDSRDRYRRGERVLLFLYPPSKLGLTSPVGGNMGRFEVGGDGRVLLPPSLVPGHSGPTRSQNNSRVDISELAKRVRSAGTTR